MEIAISQKDHGHPLVVGACDWQTHWNRKTYRLYIDFITIIFNSSSRLGSDLRQQFTAGHRSLPRREVLTYVILQHPWFFLTE